MNAFQLLMIVVQLTIYLTVLFFKAIYYLLYYIWRGAVWLLKLLWHGLRALFGWVGDKNREKAQRKAEEERQAEEARRRAQEEAEWVEKKNRAYTKLVDSGMDPEVAEELMDKAEDAKKKGTKLVLHFTSNKQKNEAADVGTDEG